MGFLMTHAGICIPYRSHLSGKRLALVLEQEPGLLLQQPEQVALLQPPELLAVVPASLTPVEVRLPQLRSVVSVLRPWDMVVSALL